MQRFCDRISMVRMMLLCFRSNLEEVERVDNLTKEQREKNMRNIRSKDTQIELISRKALWHRGYRYRKNYGQLPGKPDIAITKYRITIFCDSEFFHGKNWYQVQLPRIRRGNNPEYWEKKISRNIERDNEVNQALTNIGWTVTRFWGKDVKSNTDRCIDIVEEGIFENRIAASDIASEPYIIEE